MCLEGDVKGVSSYKHTLPHRSSAADNSMEGDVKGVSYYNHILTRRISEGDKSMEGDANRATEINSRYNTEVVNRYLRRRKSCKPI